MMTSCSLLTVLIAISATVFLIDPLEAKSVLTPIMMIIIIHNAGITTIISIIVWILVDTMNKDGVCIEVLFLFIANFK